MSVAPESGDNQPQPELPPPSPVPPRELPPRVWPVFVVCLAAFVGAVVAQVVAVVVLILWHVAQGEEIRQVTKDVQSLVTTPEAFILFVMTSQTVIGLAAIVPAWLSREPALQRLGLVTARLPAWGYPIVAIGALLPLAVGVALAHALARVIAPDPSVAQLYEQMTWSAAVPFIVTIALAPGFMEELLFRGYMQRRLLQRWSAATAILVTSVLFALMHVMPHAMVNAFVIGLWLGVLAWRTGSVWPGVVCHAFINGSWNVWNIGRNLEVFPEDTPTGVAVGVGAVIVVCFAVSAWLISRPQPVAESAPSSPGDQ